VNSLEAVE